ncbi:MAG TPA: hypothetical protein VFT29_18645 [Gemmatimonadaceae bacterium]|nr:hypothetical protein [Gemmatimonadaceae bacterium]
MNRYDPLVTRTTHAVLETKGATPSELRWAAFHRRAEELPAALKPYVEKVARNAYKVSDEDIEGLKRAGYSEDQIFEVTVSAALGAALQRLERGLIALHESKS